MKASHVRGPKAHSSWALPALLMLVWFLVLPMVAEAQPSDGNGAVTGRVLAPDQRPLTGAAIEVLGLDRVRMTGSNGTFSFPNLAPGHYTLRVSLLGYAPDENEIEIQAGETSYALITLRTQAVQLDGIDVSAVLEGQARALMDQRLSDNIVSVVSSDGIGRFPDLNMADAMNRLPGISLVRFRGEGVSLNIRGAPPEFSAVAINGVNLPTANDGRATNLNAFTTDVVGSVEVAKALTPAMDASSIGGRVNIRTQGALTAGQRRMQLTPAVGYSELGEVGNYNGSFSFGEIFGQDRNIGLLLSASRSRIGRELDNVENSWGWNDEVQDFRPTESLTKAYDIVRTRASYSARLDWLPSERSSFFLSGTHSFLDNREERHNVRFRLGDRGTYGAGSNSVSGTAHNFGARWNYHDRRTQTNTQMFSGGGTYQTSLGHLDFTGAFSRARSEIPQGRMYVEYRTPSTFGMSVQYDYSDPDFPVFTPLDPVTGQPNGSLSLAQNPADFNFYEFNSRQNLVRDDQITLAANFTVPTTLAELPTSFQFGVKADLSERDREYRFFRTRNEPGAVPLAAMLGDRPNNNFRRYDFGNRFQNNLVRAAETSVQNMDLVPGSSFPNDYVLTEGIYAAYAMQTTDIGRLRLLGGVRMEHARAGGEGYVTRDGWQSWEEGTTSRVDTYVFPSLHATFRATPEFVLRAAATSGIIRPRMSHMRPSGSINEEASIPTFSGSNPDIRPTRSNGLDLMAEYYLPLGILSGGLFYKSLQDVVFTVTRDGTAEDEFLGQSLEGYRISRAENSPSGRIAGFEVSLDRPLDFLPGWLRYTGIMTNYTQTRSSATHPQTGERLTLASQAKHSTNVSSYFDRGPLNVRLSMNYQSDYLNSLNNDPRLHLYISGREIVDLTASYDVRPGMGLFVEATNLTDSVQRRYRGVESRVDELEQFGRALTLGLRLTR